MWTGFDIGIDDLARLFWIYYELDIGLLSGTIYAGLICDGVCWAKPKPLCCETTVTLAGYECKIPLEFLF